MSNPTKTSSRDVQDMIESEQISIIQRISRVQALQIVVVLLAIVIVFSVMAPDAFLTVFNLRAILMNTSILVVLGIGVTFVIITLLTFVVLRDRRGRRVKRWRWRRRWRWRW